MSSGHFRKQTPHGHEEKFGLEQLARLGQIRVVQVIAVDDHSITLERLQATRPDLEFWRRFGRELARHHSSGNDHFGFGIDNHCGPTEQPNPEIPITQISWADYFIRYRIENLLSHPRLTSVTDLRSAYSKAKDKIKKILESVNEAPSLVHGDLWNGNFVCIEEEGERLPVLIDPAPYWGHRESDLAMSELFGGFAPDFYSAYEGESPLAQGYSNRKKVYQLYHLLNHSAIFGSSYHAQTLRLFAELDFT